MKQISFTKDRKIVTFVIEGKTIRYQDEIWKHGIRIMPLDKEMVKSMLHSRKSQIKAMGLLIFDANQGKNLEEYEAAKTEEDLVEIVRKDALSKGLMEIKI